MTQKIVSALSYSSNNSGGGWWLKDEDWFALEDAGWIVHWVHDSDLDHNGQKHEPKDSVSWSKHDHSYGDFILVPAPRPSLPVDSPDRYMGALATSAIKPGVTDPDDAIEAWARLTGQNPSDEGCNCCGPPHNFTYYNAEGTSRFSVVEVVRTDLRWS